MRVGDEARWEKKLFHLLIANQEKGYSLSSIVPSDFSNDPCTFSSKKIFLGGNSDIYYLLNGELGLPCNMLFRYPQNKGNWNSFIY